MSVQPENLGAAGAGGGPEGEAGPSETTPLAAKIEGRDVPTTPEAAVSPAEQASASEDGEAIA